jgi:hypothetical protein
MGMPLTNTKTCERCGVYLLHGPHRIIIQAPFMDYRGRLCVDCCDILTGKLLQALEAFQTREVNR